MRLSLLVFLFFFELIMDQLYDSLFVCQEILKNLIIHVQCLLPFLLLKKCELGDF